MRTVIVRRAYGLVIAAAVLGAGLHGAAFVRSCIGEPMRSGTCGALSTGVLTWLLFALAARPGGAARVALRVMMGAMIAGGLNAALVGTLLALLGDRSVARELAAVVMVGGMFGACLGGLFGIVLALPAALLGWATSEPCRGAPWWIALALGVWLAVVALWEPLLPYGAAAGEGLALLAYGLAALSSGIALVAAVRLAHDALWLARVRRGRVAGYAIVPASTMLAASELLPWGPISCHDALLVREHHAPDAVYRGVRAREPIAYVRA